MGIVSTKPTTHKPELSSALTTEKSTIPATKGKTPLIQLADENHTTSGTHSTVPRYAKMNFHTYGNTNGPFIWTHTCELFFKNYHTTEAKSLEWLSFTCWEKHHNGIIDLNERRAQ